MKFSRTIFFAPLMALICSCGGNSGEAADMARAVADSGKNEVVETIMGRRSIRAYKDTPVEKEKLQVIAECGINAPSDGSGNLDCGLLGENMMLAAQSLGLGTCCLGGCISFINSDPSAAPYLDKLTVPEGYTLLYAIAVGYPDEAPEAKPRDAAKVKFID